MTVNILYSACIRNTNNAPTLFNMQHSYIGGEVSELDSKHVPNEHY